MTLKHIVPGAVNSRAVIHNGDIFMSGIVADNMSAGMKAQTTDVLVKIDCLALRCANKVFRPALPSFTGNPYVDKVVFKINTPCFMAGNIVDQNGDLFTNTHTGISGKDKFKLLNLVLTMIENGLQGLRSDLGNGLIQFGGPQARPG